MRTVLPLVLVACSVTAAHATPVDTTFPTFGPNSFLTAAAVSGDTLFLAGHARWVGPLTGGGVPVSATGMAPLAGFPHVNGHVLTATSDGAGGWYIGGSFTHVGGHPHVNLAHIRADLSVDTWGPSTNGDVIAIVAAGADVYFGGTFTSVDGQPSSGFAGVGGSTGTPVLNPPMGGLVAALATDGSSVFLGGEFTTADGVARTRLAAFRLSDHTLTGWTAAANARVTALSFANGYIYAGGDFTTVSGLPRGGAAALDPITAVPTAWDPHMGTVATDGVRALLPVGDRIYLGGGFTQMGGASRLALAAVDTASGALLPWAPQATGDGAATVTSLELAGSDVVAGGTFAAVGGMARSNLVRLDTSTGAPLPGAPEAPGEARALARSGSNLFAGGRFSTLGAVRRGDLLALRISTGELLPWAPNATHDDGYASNLTSIAVDADRVYVGQQFYEPVAGVFVGEVHAYSRATGAKLWAHLVYPGVNALALRDTVLYVGGEFSSPSRAVVPLNAATGAEIPWGVAVDAKAYALQATPAGLVVGGAFTSLGGQPRTNLAMLDWATGLATPWDPGPDGAVWALAAAGNTLYCGGDFANVGGELRAGLAAVALDSGAPEAWDPGVNATVRALAIQHGVVFAGGGFTVAGGQARTGLAALNPSDGTVLPLDARIGLGQSVMTVGFAGGHTFAAGSQTSAGSEPTQALTVVVGPDPVLAVDGPRKRASPASLRVEPQPARTVAQVMLRLPRETDAEIGLYDLTGRRLAVLVPWGHHAAGEYRVALEPRQLQPGIYLVRAITPEGDIAGKLVVLP